MGNQTGSKDRAKDLERILREAAGRKGKKYVLRLFVSGATARSTRAIANITRICEKYLKGRYDLQVIDIYKQPQVARDEQMIAAPTLVKKAPPPLRRLIGDLSDTRRVLLGLELIEEDQSQEEGRDKDST